MKFFLVNQVKCAQSIVFNRKLLLVTTRIILKRGALNFRIVYYICIYERMDGEACFKQSSSIRKSKKGGNENSERFPHTLYTHAHKRKDTTSETHKSSKWMSRRVQRSAFLVRFFSLSLFLLKSYFLILGLA